MLLDYLWLIIQHAKGSSSSGKRPKRVYIVEVDGRDYRVTEDGLDAFLEATKAKAKEPKPVKLGKKKRLVSNDEPTQIVIKSDVPDLVQQQIAEANERMRHYYMVAMILYLQEQDDEECLLMLL